MENFFYNDEFCSGPEDLLYHLDIDEENFDELPDDWSIEVLGSTKEKIVLLDPEVLINLIMDSNEDRFPEDADQVLHKIEEALKQSVDFEKLNSLLPSLYYLNYKDKEVITKQDLGDLCGFKIPGKELGLH